MSGRPRCCRRHFLGTGRRIRDHLPVREPQHGPPEPSENPVLPCVALPPEERLVGVAVDLDRCPRRRMRDVDLVVVRLRPCRHRQLQHPALAQRLEKFRLCDRRTCPVSAADLRTPVAPRSTGRRRPCLRSWVAHRVRPLHALAVHRPFGLGLLGPTAAARPRADTLCLWASLPVVELLWRQLERSPASGTLCHARSLARFPLLVRSPGPSRLASKTDGSACTRQFARRRSARARATSAHATSAAQRDARRENHLRGRTMGRDRQRESTQSADLRQACPLGSTHRPQARRIQRAMCASVSVVF